MTGERENRTIEGERIGGGRNEGREEGKRMKHKDNRQN